MSDAGYSGTPLAKKLGFKDGQLVLILNQPNHYFNLFSSLPEILEAHEGDNEIDIIHYFVTNRTKFQSDFIRLVKQIKRDGMIWVSWPKKSSKVPTDLDENIIRAFGLSQGLVDVKVCAVDKIWSGLKFVYRLKDR